MTKQELNTSYKVVYERKFSFKKLLGRLVGKRNLEQDQNIQEAMKEWPEDFEVVVGKADEELLSGKSAVVEIGGYDGQALKAAMETHCERYGKLPSEIYSMKIEDIDVYVKQTMQEYERKGISTLAEMEEAIGERRPFLGPHSRGIVEDGYYKVYVADDLIYDGKADYFDCQWKRFQIYSEIQHMVAKRIFGRDLATIRKEGKKESDKSQ